MGLWLVAFWLLGMYVVPRAARLLLGVDHGLLSTRSQVRGDDRATGD